MARLERTFQSCPSAARRRRPRLGRQVLPHRLRRASRHIPRTGSAPVDDFIRQMEPRVELATKEAVTRAATLVHSGDRTTMLAVLGAAMAIGWLLVKAANPSVVANR